MPVSMILFAILTVLVDTLSLSHAATSTLYTPLPDPLNTNTTLYVLGNHNTQTRLQCTLLCRSTEGCVGFVYKTDTRSCRPLSDTGTESGTYTHTPGDVVHINPCDLSDNPGCEHVCENVDGVAVCSCVVGYTLEDDGRTCDCRSTYTAISGSVTPALYPLDAPAGDVCTYTIVPPTGKFTELNIERLRLGGSDYSCDTGNTLTIYDGAMEKIGRVCSSWDTELGKFLLSGVVLVANLTASELPYPTSPFSITYTTKDSHDCVSTKVFTEPSGTITSPNYPGRYYNMLECGYHISAPYGFYITLSFSAFRVEDGSSCKYDGVWIYDGDPGSTSMITYGCGEKSSWGPFNSTGNSMLVAFWTDISYDDEGWSCTYETHPLCDVGWKAVGDKCYLFAECSPPGCSANTANTECGSVGLAIVLATVDSQALNDEIATELPNMWVWVGGNDVVSEGTWKWVADDTPLTSGFTNWNPTPAQPSNSTPDYDCMYVDTSNKYWYDYTCTSYQGTQGYVCQVIVPT